jgi:hypothetical protein
MNIEKLTEANNRLDANFSADHKDFAVWWHKHDHCDSEPKWQVAARVAYKCQRYRNEFMDAKQIGAA